MNEELMEQMLGGKKQRSGNPFHESVWVNAVMSVLAADNDAILAASRADMVLAAYKLRFDEITTGMQ